MCDHSFTSIPGSSKKKKKKANNGVSTCRRESKGQKLKGSQALPVWLQRERASRSGALTRPSSLVWVGKNHEKQVTKPYMAPSCGREG